MNAVSLIVGTTSLSASSRVLNALRDPLAMLVLLGGLGSLIMLVIFIRSDR